MKIIKKGAKMNEIKQKVALKLKQLAGYWPTDLPVGMTDLENFASDIFETYDIPDKRSYRHAVATMIMHLGPQTNKVPKMYFVKSIRKAMANQIAFEKIQAIKEEEKAEMEAVKKEAEIVAQDANETVVS
jgi:hypothetical protein